MFKKYENKLKTQFRKLLFSTNEIYSKPLKIDEEKAISFMWNKVLDNTGIIMINRLRKTGPKLGLRVETIICKDGNFNHRVKEIIENTVISQSNLKLDDILLEINGVNLRQLSYDQLTIFLGELPNNMQLVFRRQDIYEQIDQISLTRSAKIDSTENPRQLYTNQIIINAKKGIGHGLTFYNQNSNGNPFCTISGVNEFGYFGIDKRVSALDHIEQIDQISTVGYTQKQLEKLLTSYNNRCFILFFSKFRYISQDSNKSIDCISDCGHQHDKISELSSLNFPYKSLTRSTPNMHSKTRPKHLKKIKNEEAIIVKTKQLEANQEIDVVSIQINTEDDLRLYLLDIDNGNHKMSKICGIHPKSSLLNRFHVNDEIVKINNDIVEELTSLEIGNLMKKLHCNSKLISVDVNRSSGTNLEDDVSSSIIFSTESSMNSIDSDLLTSADNSSIDPYEPAVNNERIIVTLKRYNNKFGLKIINKDGPIVEQISNNEKSDEHNDLNQIRPGDIIDRINDIYVRDKSRHFVLTIIKSCGESMRLELLRRPSLPYMPPHPRLSESVSLTEPVSLKVDPNDTLLRCNSSTQNQSTSIQNEIFCL